MSFISSVTCAGHLIEFDDLGKDNHCHSCCLFLNSDYGLQLSTHPVENILLLPPVPIMGYSHFYMQTGRPKGSRNIQLINTESFSVPLMDYKSWACSALLRVSIQCYMQAGSM